MGTKASKVPAVEERRRRLDESDVPVGRQPNIVELARLGYEEIVKAIIRPPRALYVPSDLGSDSFAYKDVVFVREDFSVPNSVGHMLQASMWRPAPQYAPIQPMACVIYLHGNSGCRIGALEVMQTVLNEGACLVSFDFSGSGISEGDWVTLGHHEASDVLAVIAHLRDDPRVSTIALWGRSMGAVTAIFAAEADPSIAALVLDSPFCDLRQLCMELVDTGRNAGDGPLATMPKWAVDMGAAGLLRMVRGTILKRTTPAPHPSPSQTTTDASCTACLPMRSASPSMGVGGGGAGAGGGMGRQTNAYRRAHTGLDIDALRPLDAVSSTFVPALFVAGEGDAFVRPHHARTLQAAYAGDSSVTTLPGQDHNSLRPQEWMDTAACFLRSRLCVPEEHALWMRPYLPVGVGVGMGRQAQRQARREARVQGRMRGRATDVEASTGQSKDGTIPILHNRAEDDTIGTMARTREGTGTGTGAASRLGEVEEDEDESEEQGGQAAYRGSSGGGQGVGYTGPESIQVEEEEYVGSAPWEGLVERAAWAAATRAARAGGQGMHTMHRADRSSRPATGGAGEGEGAPLSPSTPSSLDMDTGLVLGSDLAAEEDALLQAAIEASLREEGRSEARMAGAPR